MNDLNFEEVDAGAVTSDDIPATDPSKPMQAGGQSDAQAAGGVKKGRKNKRPAEGTDPNSSATRPGQAAKQRSDHPRSVRITSVEGQGLMDDGLVLGVASVSNKQYAFRDASEALKFLTRRIYNGETISPEAQRAQTVLGQLRSARTVKQWAGQMTDWFARAAKAGANRGAPNMNTINDALGRLTDPLFSDLVTSAREVISTAERLRGIEAPVDSTTGTADEAAIMPQIQELVTHGQEAAAQVQSWNPQVSTVFAISANTQGADVQPGTADEAEQQENPEGAGDSPV